MSIEKRLDRASYSGLQTCGSVWSCPCCAPKIAAERAADVALALTSWHARGGRVAMVTLTLRHSRADRLEALLDGLSGAWAAIRKHRVSGPMLATLAHGWIKRLEITSGPSGWHPHLHVLVLLHGDVSDDQAQALGPAMLGPWASRLVRQGLGEPDQEHGVTVKLLDLATAHENVARYVTSTEYAAAPGTLSAALELTSPGTKRARGQNRTPMQLLADLVERGEATDLGLWREYEQATRGRRSLQWSIGLRDDLMADVPELSDEQAAEQNDGHGRLIGCLDRDTWRRIRRWSHGPATVLNWAEVYDDDDQARDLIARQLARHGLGHLEAGLAPAQPSG